VTYGKGKVFLTIGLVLLSVVAVTAVLGSTVLPVYARRMRNGEEGGWPRNLTEEQREAIRPRAQEMTRWGDGICRRENRCVIQAWECPRLPGLKRFLANSGVVTFNGTIVAHARNILIVDSNGMRLNVILPPAWNRGSEVMGVGKLFNQSYIANGDSVTVKALKATYTNAQGVTISTILAYEIVDNTTGNHLYAVLPFNIEG